MKRRTFILSSSFVAAVIPVAYYFKKNKWKKTDAVSLPYFLSTVCDEAALKAIGNAFLKQRPAENSKKILKAAILSGARVAKDDETAIAEFIISKITADFKNNNMLLAEAWVITETEARQCALFSLT